MRFPLQYQVYFIVSIVLHLALFFSLLTSSLRLEKSSNSFEATVEFKAPAPVPVAPVVSGSVAGSVKGTPPGSALGPLSSQSLSVKKLDEILKDRSIKVSAGKDLNQTIITKKSDLLGYLRANKQTKSASEIPEKTAKAKADLSKSMPRAAEKPDKGTNLPPAGTPASAEQEVEPVANGTTEQISQTEQPVTAAQRIWQKKNDDLAYRRMLKKLITANWIVPPVKVKDFQILIEAVIDQNGNLVKMEQLEGSGLAILDEAAKKAIQVSAPFPKFPVSINEGGKEFKAIFRFTPDQIIF